MPQVMTEEEAGKKTCPFMSRRIPGALADPDIADHVACLGSSCACWGWVDGEEGERVMERRVQKGRPEDDTNFSWRLVKSDHEGIGTFERFTGRISKRRGQCEAMSPNITVEGS